MVQDGGLGENPRYVALPENARYDEAAGLHMFEGAIMKILIVSILAICFGHMLPAQSPLSFGAGGGAFDFSAVSKLFGNNQQFVALTESRAAGAKPGEETVIAGKLTYLDGQSRFEVDLTKMKSSKLTTDGAAKLKQSGMDILVMISRPDKQTAYLMYPNLSAYIEKPVPGTASNAAQASVIKVEELGRENLDGQACIKNKVSLTDSNGRAREYTVWNATGLRNFPLKLEITEGGTPIVMLFRNVKFEKPGANEFEPPGTFKKFTSLTEIVQKGAVGRIQQPHMVPKPK
jgi:hypothetical protein